jgi:sulfur carrier protein
LNIKLNGEARDIQDGMSIQHLLMHLQLGSERVAVEKNGVIVQRTDFQTETLMHGDTVEVVRFVGGG